MNASPRPASTRRIAILAPMPNELSPVIERLELVRSDGPTSAPWRGVVGSLEVVAGRTGIGMRRAADAAERMLDETTPDHLFVVGIAGAIGPGSRIGASIDPERVRSLDTGEELRPTRLEAGEGHGVLVSSDRLLEPGEALALAREGVVAVDMETAAIGSVCARRGCPWSVFRALSDRADDGSTDPAVLELVDAEGTPKLGAVARFLLTRPHRIPQLVRLARGTNEATSRAAEAAVAALRSLDAGSRAEEPREETGR